MFCAKKTSKLISLFLIFVFVSLTVLDINISQAYGLNYFSDVAESNYYSESVNQMFEKGFIKGYPDGEFKAKNNVTVAEALTLIFRVAGVKYKKSENPDYWYSDVLNKAKALKIVNSKVDPNTKATRLDIGKYIIGIYHLNTNNVSTTNVFTDTNLLVANVMYEYDVFNGVPVSNGVAYLPYESITRADLCIVLNRLNEKLNSPYLEKITVGSNVIDNSPTSLEDITLIMKALGESPSYTLTIPYYYDLLNYEYYSEIKDKYRIAFEYCFSTYPENFSFTPNLSIKRQVNGSDEGSLVLTLYNLNIEFEEVLRMRKEFQETTEETITHLKEKGKLSEDLTDLETLRILFEYVVINTEYDLEFSNSSYTGYGAAVDKKAVCQGYSAYFNNLCKNLGYDVEGVAGVVTASNEEHMWSRVKIANIWHYFDTTFADSVPNKENYCDYYYFDISYIELMKDRVENNY